MYACAIAVPSTGSWKKFDASLSRVSCIPPLMSKLRRRNRRLYNTYWRWQGRHSCSLHSAPKRSRQRRRLYSKSGLLRYAQAAVVTYTGRCLWSVVQARRATRGAP